PPPPPLVRPAHPYCRGALAFEVVGSKDELVAQVVAEAGDSRRVSTQLKAHFPEAVVSPEDSYLRNRWTEERESEPAEAKEPGTAEGEEPAMEILEFGLDQEFML